jgi:hypothetical protein
MASPSPSFTPLSAWADASCQELDGHYQTFRDLIQPRFAEEDKMARALAECSWRCSQVLHVHGVDEMMTMKARGWFWLRSRPPGLCTPWPC